ncbi:hypothetical protein, partial [Klebsiella pneumoniae]
QTLNTENRRWLSPSVIGIAVRFCAPCVPTWRQIIVSVAQADKLIIALPGDKSKMSIYEKIAISWRSALPFPDSADRMRGVT